MKKVCQHCGASMMEHRHTLSVAMVEGLRRLCKFPGPINIKKLGLTRNQWDNFQKLRYWGLVEKSYDKAGKRLGGHWAATKLGKAFVLGKISAPKVVWTYRGRSVRVEGVTTFVNDVIQGYKMREDYSAEAVPHEQQLSFDHSSGAV